MKFTVSQESSLAAFREFLEGGEQVFILRGAAGTGKTTIVVEFLKILENAHRRFAVMAPTGRAAHIVASKTGESATTIHRGIYALQSLTTRQQEGKSEKETEGSVHVRFALKLNEHPRDMVYIVDESSMISDHYSEAEAFSFGSGRLLRDLFEFAERRKIVFVGDHAQLPPVGMNSSPALDKEYLTQNYNCGVTEVTLREVMRQRQGSVMFANADRVRDCIERGSFVEFHLSNGDDCDAENEDLLRPYFRQSEKKPDARSAIIAYSNRQATEYNKAIRRHYFGADAQRLLPGDLLMITRNNYAYEYELFNGNIVKVEACDPDGRVESRIVRINAGKGHIESVQLRFRKALLKFRTGDKAVQVEVTLLDNNLDESFGTTDNMIARALKVDFDKRLPQEIRDALPQISKQLRNKGEKFSEKLQEIYEAYMRRLKSDPYYNAVLCKYGYAMTCHKAQGGEWERVFVDMCRYGGTANKDYFRWAYTAITRASGKLWHFRSPDFNYISGLKVEPIQRSSNIKVSVYCGDGDFRLGRYARIEKLAAREGLTVFEDTSRDYQHRVTFTDADGQACTFTLWYNKRGYSNRDVLLNCDNEELEMLCRAIIEKSGIPEEVPFTGTDRPFATKLVSFLRSQLEETGIQLLDITAEQYQDVFHLKTDGYARLCLHYTDKGNYTYMKLQSSLGEADAKLEALRQRFI